MSILLEEIALAKKDGKTLFYNTSGSKLAYQLGVKHISSAEYLGFADTLPNGDLRIKKDLILIDFERELLLNLNKSSLITPIKLASY